VVHKLTSEKQCSKYGSKAELMPTKNKKIIGENLEGENLFIDILGFLAGYI
jgi:hypothetical protein